MSTVNKQEFLATLASGLNGLPQNDINERLTFYSEMIDDRMEEGLSEQEAVAQIGSVEVVIAQIMSEVPLSKIVKEKVKPKRNLKVWEIVALIIGSPVWLSLLLAATAFVLAIYVLIWSVIVAAYVVDAAILVCGGASVFAAYIFGSAFNFPGVGCAVGAAMVCVGSSVLLFFLFNQLTKFVVFLTKKSGMAIKSALVGKEKLT